MPVTLPKIGSSVSLPSLPQFPALSDSIALGEFVKKQTGSYRSLDTEVVRFDPGSGLEKALGLSRWGPLSQQNEYRVAGFDQYYRNLIRVTTVTY